jgi:hypothetical protein
MFSLFINAYRKKVREHGKYAHLKVSKTEFLRYLQSARDETLIENNFKAAFAAAGLISWDLIRVVKKIDLKYAQVLKRRFRDYIFFFSYLSISFAQFRKKAKLVLYTPLSRIYRPRDLYNRF